MAAFRRAIEPLEDRYVMANYAFAAIEMTGQEQYLLELINRARSDPAAEASRYGIGLNAGLNPGTITTSAKQPLAPNQALIEAAGDHSQDMLDRDYFSHTSPNPAPNGASFTDRMATAGYGSYSSAGENIGWGGSSGPIDQNAHVDYRHEALFRSAGHRQNMLTPGFRESGPGVRYGNYQGYNASMVTELFASRTGGYFLTGVAFDDANRNDFYTIGEGLGGITIVATNAANGDTYTTTTGASGGFALRAPNGTYTIVASGGSLGGSQTVSNVVLNGANLKIDFLAASNMPPTATIAGPAAAVPYQPLSYTFSAVDDDQSSASAPITYVIDWLGDGSDVQTIVGVAAGVTVQHTFASIGNRTIRVTAEDEFGGVSEEESLQVSVTQSLLQNGSLYVGGTEAGDRVYFYEADDGRIYFRLGTFSPRFTVSNEIVVYGGAGNDLVVMDETSTVSIVVFGGEGDDRLYGGAGADELFGEAGRDTLEGRTGHDRLAGGDNDDLVSGQQGNDTIDGGAGNDDLRGGRGNDIVRGGLGRDTIRGDEGNDVLLGGDGDDRLDATIGRDLLVGGAGRDTLYGRDGGALLIGGSTVFDSASQGNDAALAALLAEWASTRSLADRVANLTGRGAGTRANSNVFLTASTLLDDSERWDYLYGGLGEDAYFIFNRFDVVSTSATGDLIENV